MNIIENCWGLLDQQLTRAKANNNQTWYDKIRAAWRKVGQDSINKLVAGMKKRFQLIVENEGEWCPHH
jgi:hypothetical protein